MSCFESLKDFDVDFKDILESNSQYKLVFEAFGRVLEDLLYRSLKKVPHHVINN